MQKIIVIGFPHCGTSILKSIIGHIDDVEEVVDETTIIKKKSKKSKKSKKYIVCKYPFVLDRFFTEKYNEYIKIFIIRNPLYVFSSLNKRYTYDIPDNHSINVYINTIKTFIHYKKNNTSNVYLIKYEDMFNENYHQLKQILNSIGLKYTNKIFDNINYTNKIASSINIEDIKSKPDNKEHGDYRTWQINQPFINNNEKSKIDLTHEQIETIYKNVFINIIYPDIKTHI
jgi:hypothetical protein